MAGLVHPRGGPRPTSSAAEVAVYDALVRHLPDGWRAWHSLRVRTQRGREGEGDFVIAAPDRGLVVLEVKGGSMRLENGRWYQNEKPMKKPPRDQAHKYVRLLVDAMKERGVEAPPYGVACIFPDVNFTERPPSGDLTGLILGRRDLGALRAALPALFERALPSDVPIPSSRRWLDMLHDLWGETWVPSLSLRDSVQAAGERLVSLDAEQMVVLDIAGESRRAVVRGGAGSGKSLVARELCAREARKGGRVLYLCFTEALGRHMDQHLQALRLGPGSARGYPIRRLAAELLETAGIPVRSDDPDFWKHASLQAACDALPRAAPDAPDLIVVDEGQDLEQVDWMLVEALSRGGAVWVFTDERQAFWQDRAIPESMTRGTASLQLKAQRRNPPGVWNLASSYAGDGAGSAAVLDSSVRLVEVAPDKLAACLRHELNELRRAGAACEEIAVLSLAGQSLSAIMRSDKIGDHAVVRADHADAGHRIVLDTFLRFKGLERPFILLVELAAGAISKYDTRMHIALTRATVQTLILCEPDHCDRDERLQRLRQRAATSLTEGAA